MGAAKWIKWIVPVCGVLLCGCQFPAQIFWSPDKAQAVYLNGNGQQAFVVREDGSLAARLGPSSGGFAWSADSRTLFFASTDSQLQVPLAPVHREWLNTALPPVPDASAPASAPASAESGNQPTSLCRWRDGRSTTLLGLGAKTVWTMNLSPDQKWLAMVCPVSSKAPKDGADHCELYVWHLDSQRLYLLSTCCGLGMCFTAPERLAYVQADDQAEHPQATGHVIELTLDPAGAQVSGHVLLDVLWRQTPWLQPLKNDLLLTSAPRSYPARPVDDGEPPHYRLYHFSRENAGLAALAEDVGPLFMPSPDGSRILFAKVAPRTRTMAEKQELAVMNVNGSDTHVLRDLSPYRQLPLWPNWHGNDQITLVAPAEQATTVPATWPQLLYVDVIQYRLTATGRLEPIRNLSQQWEQQMKPSYPNASEPAKP